MYGGTKSEMERLIKDANKLRKAQGKNANLTIDSYADVIEAIHTVQEEMGITGTTALEAEKTIQGSLASTKASWQNLIVAFGSGKGIKEAMGQLTENAKNLFHNVLPVVKSGLEGLGTFIKEMAPVVVAELPGVVREILPAFLDAASSLFNSVVSVFPSLINGIFSVLENQLIPAIAGLLADLLGLTGEEKEAFIRNLRVAYYTIKIGISNAIKTVKEAWENHIKPVVVAVWEYVTGTLVPFVVDAWENKIKPAIQTAIEAIKQFWEETLKPAWKDLVAFVTETLWPAIQEVWETNIKPTIETVFNVITGLWNETLKPAWEDLIAFCEETLFPKLQEIWETMIQPIIGNVFQVWQTLWEETIKPVFEGIIAFFQDVFKGDWDSAWQDIGGIFEGIWNGFETIVQKSFENIQTIITGALEAIGIDTEDLKKTYLEPLQEFISGAFKVAWDALSTFFSETLPNAISTVSTALNDFWNNVIIPVKDYVSDKFLAAWTEIKSYWETDLEPRIQALKDAFNTFKDNVLSPVANFVTGTFKSAWDTISKFFNGDVGDSVSKVGSGFDNLKKKFLKPLADWVNGTFKAAWDGLKTALNGLLDFVTGVFSGNWRDAWQGLIDMISAPFNTLKTVLKEPINAVIRMINSMISKIESAINKVVDGINNHLRIDVDFGWNPFTGQSLGGIHWGANLSRVNWGRIDELYKGGVLRSGQHALVGEGGPEYIRMIGEHAFVQPLSKDNPLNNRGTTFNATFNITAQPGQNVEELAREIERVMTRWATQKAVAFA